MCVISIKPFFSIWPKSQDIKYIIFKGLSLKQIKRRKLRKWMKKIFFFEGESPTLIFEERANFVGSMIRTKENTNVPRPSIYVLLRPISFMQHIIMIALRNFCSHTRFIHPSRDVLWNVEISVKIFKISVQNLTLSWRRPLSYRNQSIICGANQWTGFYMITASVMKGLNVIFGVDSTCINGLANLMCIPWCQCREWRAILTECPLIY